MPEHREGTPQRLRDLESFLWWDFDLEAWVAWCDKRGIDAVTAQRSLDPAKAIQEVLRRHEAANNGMPQEADATAQLNLAIQRYDVRPRVKGAGEIDFVCANPGDPVGRILERVMEAMVCGDWTRFKLCRDTACGASYFDASKTGTKTWCTMKTCGSRNKMRRYRARASERAAMEV